MKLTTLFTIFCYFICSFITPISAQDTTIVEQLIIPISTGSDDVEQQADGSMYINSTDIEMTYDIDAAVGQAIGLRFANVQLTDATTIDAAYIQFQVDEVSSELCNLQIYAENNGDAQPFTDAMFDVTNRSTTQLVNWAPDAWTVVGAQTETQRTPDLTAIISMVLNQANWEHGNALNFIIQGFGTRIASAYESNPAFAAQLVIETSTTAVGGDLENVYINELMPANSVVSDEYGETDDWLELYNAKPYAVLASGLYISDDATDLMKWQLPEAVVIPAEGFLQLWLDDAPEQGNLHLPFQLTSAGESVFISQEQNGTLVTLDEVTFPETPENISYGRQTDGNAPWVFFGEYSPQQSNNGKGLYLNANVELSLAGGVYPTGTNLTMTCSDPDAIIRYTVDGTTPNSSSNVYTQAIVLGQTMTVKAAAFKPTFASSAVVEAFYLINASHELPVVHLSINPAHLWDNEEGMYVAGTNGIAGFCSGEPKNWNQDWERPVALDYFSDEGMHEFRVKAGIKIGGACSRGFAMKSFNIFLKEDEYGDDKVNYPLFEALDIDEFKRFKLRNSGNDYPLTMIRDGAINTMLHQQVDIDLMAYQPTVVYINGAYFGCYGMREFQNRHYLASHHGVDKDSLDLIKNPFYGDANVKEGDLEDWNDLTNYINTHNMQNPVFMTTVEQRMDVNEFMNYQLAQIYIANYDWPGNNLAVWRDRREVSGKWRWLFYDVDISTNYAQWSPSDYTYDALAHATNANGEAWPNGATSTLFLRKLLENEGFEQEFSQRGCTMAQTIFDQDRTTFIIDSLADNIASEMPAFFNEFNNSPTDWVLWEANPAGGSLGAWQVHLSTFKSFFIQRLNYHLAQFQNKFDYDGTYYLSMNYTANTNGDVVFHQNEMAIPYGYTARYFQNVPMQIKAIPKPGYYFVRWEETGDTNPIIQFQSDTDQVLTPIFQSDDSTDIEVPVVNYSTHFTAFPNPAGDELSFEYQALVTTDFNIQVYNALGQIIYEKELLAKVFSERYTIDIKGWTKGVYFIKQTINGEERVLKLIKN